MSNLIRAWTMKNKPMSDKRIIPHIEIEQMSSFTMSIKEVNNPITMINENARNGMVVRENMG